MLITLKQQSLHNPLILQHGILNPALAPLLAQDGFAGPADAPFQRLIAERTVLSAAADWPCQRPHASSNV
jgi:hypothetical protein